MVWGVQILAQSPSTYFSFLFFIKEKTKIFKNLIPFGRYVNTERVWWPWLTSPRQTHTQIKEKKKEEEKNHLPADARVWCSHKILLLLFLLWPLWLDGVTSSSDDGLWGHRRGWRTAMTCCCCCWSWLLRMLSLLWTCRLTWIISNEKKKKHTIK